MEFYEWKQEVVAKLRPYSPLEDHNISFRKECLIESRGMRPEDVDRASVSGHAMLLKNKCNHLWSVLF